MTIAEAAERTGLTRKALEIRCDRGRLRYVVKANRRRIPVSELVRAGLLEEDGTRPSEGATSDGLLGGLVPELLERLEAQAEELGRLRALTAGQATTESAKATLELELEEERKRREAAEEELERLRRRRFWRFRTSSG